MAAIKRRTLDKVSNFGKSRSLLLTTTANEIQRIRAEEGLMPLDVMLGNMTFFYSTAIQANAQLADLEREEAKGVVATAVRQDKIKELRDLATKARLHSQGCAVDAAPYLHARAVKRIVVAGDADAPLQHEHAYKLVEEYKDSGDSELQDVYLAAIRGEALPSPQQQIIPPAKIKRADK